MQCIGYNILSEPKFLMRSLSLAGAVLLILAETRTSTHTVFDLPTLGGDKPKVKFKLLITRLNGVQRAPVPSAWPIPKVGSMMKSVISSDKHVLNQRERDALHHGPDTICENFGNAGINQRHTYPAEISGSRCFQSYLQLSGRIMLILMFASLVHFSSEPIEVRVTKRADSIQTPETDSDI